MSAPDPRELRRRAQGWIRHADEDARIADGCVHLEPPSLAGAAFHCQQAAEKLLKAFLVWANVDFRKTHDLDALAASVVARFPGEEPLVKPMMAWTAWNVAYRYPAEAEPEPEPSVAELKAALDLIERLAARLRSLAPADQPGRNDGGEKK